MPPMHSSFHLRLFSGKSPCPNSELDYDTWSANYLFLTDPSMSDLHLTCKILDCLLPPATNVIEHVSPQALPPMYLQLLDSVCGSVEDGDELLAKFTFSTDFTVVTDSNLLTFILTYAKLDATSYRLQEADGLSHRPHGELQDNAVLGKEHDRIKQFTLHYLKEQETPDVVLPVAVKVWPPWGFRTVFLI